MNLRLMVALAAGVAALVLIPVLTVVGLGVYGSSLGGSAKSVAGSGAELRLLPAPWIRGLGSGDSGTPMAAQEDGLPICKASPTEVQQSDRFGSGSIKSLLRGLAASKWKGSFRRPSSD